MTHYSFQHIAEIIKGRILQEESDSEISQLVLDSRRIIFPHVSLFFALAGPSRDGHQFLNDVYKKGVRNFVVNQPIPANSLPGSNVVLADDTLYALQQLAGFHRKQFAIDVIGITGSNGKTIVKEWLNQVLEENFHIVRSPKSYNSQIGVPLSVWQMNEHHELGIFEAGISLPGEMEKLERVIQPTIGVFTNIGEAHNEGFANEEEKIREKLKLFRFAKALIYNAGLASIDEIIKTTINPAVKIIPWKINQIHKQEGHSNIDVTIAGESLKIRLPFTDLASIENAATCCTVLHYFKIPFNMMQHRLMQLRHVSMRLELKKGINNCSIVNDSYSADLSSFRIALDFLSEQRQHPARTVILSDFMESGMDDEKSYALIAEALEQHNIERIIGIGEKIGLQRNQFKAVPKRQFYQSTDEFIDHFREPSINNEAILIKGARVFAFEKIDRLLSEKLHHTALEINLNSLVHNLREYRKFLKKETKVMAMVKAFAYGSGSYEIASVLQFHKVDFLAVAYADEGVALRKSGITLPIMVMNAESDSFGNLVEYSLQPAIYSISLLQAFANFLQQETIVRFPIHIEINTGMNRLGFEPNEMDEISDLLASPVFELVSVFSHLAASDDKDEKIFSSKQEDLFLQVCSILKEKIKTPFLKHISNSAAILNYPDWQMDMVRLGIGLYGIDSSDSGELELQEVSTFRSTIAQIRQVRAGETVSYGRKGIAERDLLIATVRVGYADGYPRMLGNGVGKMRVGGHLAPTIGAVCMDMTMIDITDIPDVQEDDEVILFGIELPVKQVAQWAGTIPYEILTGVSQRVKRVYFQD